MNSPGQQFLRGARAALPLLTGVVPFGLIFGALAVRSGIPRAIAQSMSSIVFAGSSQFITAQLISAGTPALVMIATAAVVNLRHMLYSASIAPYLKQLGWRWKALIAYLLTDETYAVAITHLRAQANGINSPTLHWYVFGAGIALWSTWQLSTAAGLLIGGAMPPALQLDFALPLTFIALVFPAIKNRAMLAAALVGGTVALMGAGLPLKLGLMIAAACGICAGILVEHLSSKRAKS